MRILLADDDRIVLTLVAERSYGLFADLNQLRTAPIKECGSAA